MTTDERCLDVLGITWSAGYPCVSNFGSHWPVWHPKHEVTVVITCPEPGAELTLLMILTPRLSPWSAGRCTVTRHRYLWEPLERESANEAKVGVFFRHVVSPFHSSTVCSRSSNCLSVNLGGGWKFENLERTKHSFVIAWLGWHAFESENDTESCVMSMIHLPPPLRLGHTKRWCRGAWGLRLQRCAWRRRSLTFWITDPWLGSLQGQELQNGWY